MQKKSVFISFECSSRCLFKIMKLNEAMALGTHFVDSNDQNVDVSMDIIMAGRDIHLLSGPGRVSLQGKESRQADFKDGVPQGGVLSPTLFLVFMNSIQNIIKPHVKAALYADDLALICSEESCGTAQVRLQECLTLLEPWTEDCECCQDNL